MRKYLEGCKGYDLLKENLNEEQLNFFEMEISRYEEEKNIDTTSCLDEYSDIIWWYEGLIDTESILSDWADIWKNELRGIIPLSSTYNII